MKIEIDGICKRFSGGPEVLNNIQYRDDFNSLAIIGPSGGGKSTLLRILGGLILPDSGRFLFDGQEIKLDEVSLLEYRRTIGFVFQSNGLFHHLTGRQNITMPLIKVYGFSKEEAEDKVESLLKRFGLANDGHKYPQELSGGQQQRIAIARAVAAKPRLILLDEPTSSLDPELTREVLDMIRELNEDGLSTLLVTHEMGFAKRACDKVIFLAGGRLVEHGPSRDVFENPKSDELKRFLDKILGWTA